MPNTKCKGNPKRKFTDDMQSVWYSICRLYAVKIITVCSKFEQLLNR